MMRLYAAVIPRVDAVARRYRACADFRFDGTRARISSIRESVETILRHRRSLAPLADQLAERPSTTMIGSVVC